MDFDRGHFQERRRHERFNLGLPVSCVYEFGGEQKTEKAKFINLSAGGAFMPCKNLVPPGTAFELLIDAPPGGRLIAPGAEAGGEASANVQIRTLAEVLRVERDLEAPDSGFVAVRFTSPLRILGSTETDWKL